MDRVERRGCRQHHGWPQGWVPSTSRPPQSGPSRRPFSIPPKDPLDSPLSMAGESAVVGPGGGQVTARPLLQNSIRGVQRPGVPQNPGCFPTRAPSSQGVDSP